MSQQDYLNSIRNQDSFTFEDYSEQLLDNPHLGKELSIIYFEHQESEKASSKEVWSLFNKKLNEPWGFKIRFKDLKSQANPPPAYKLSPVVSVITVSLRLLLDLFLMISDAVHFI